MSDPAIRVALEAATRTACNCDCAEVQPGCRRQMAEEIAVFLQALPGRYLETVHGPMMSMRHLAAAVEEAANA